MLKIFFISIVSFFSFINIHAFAQTPAMPSYVQALANGGAQVSYMGNDLGLDGWMTVKDGQRQYVYVTPNQEANIVGLLLDRDGKMVTATQIDRLMKSNPEYLAQEMKSKKVQKNTSQTPNVLPPKTPSAIKSPLPSPKSTPIDPSSSSEQLLADIQVAHWIEIGLSSAPIVYAFVDPECPHCHQFIDTLRATKSYEKGKIRTRLLPVGILGKDSLYEAAKLIDSPTPKKSFFDHLDGDEFALPIDEKYNTKKVQKNMALMQKWNLDVTPFLIYRSKEGSVKIVRGRPKQIEDLLSDIQ